MSRVLTLYNYWNPENYHHDSAYSSFIDLIEDVLELFSNETFAGEIIVSIINNCDGMNFNANYSVNDIFKLLIENYQALFLSKIEPLLKRENIQDYLRLRILEDMLNYSNNVDNQMYLSWCENNGNPAAEFVAHFIQLFEYVDEQTPRKWSKEVLILMEKYCKDSHVLSIISTRIYNGSVSLWRYQNNKDVYDSLSDHSNTTINIWAAQEAERMEQAIEREKKSFELDEVWNK